MNLFFSLLVGFVGGLLGWLAQQTFQRHGFFLGVPQTLQLRHQDVPADLLNYVRPGSSVGNMKKHLGAPFSVTNVDLKDGPILKVYYYKFSNLNIAAYSEDEVSIHMMTLLLPQVSTADHFPIPPLDFVLGRDNLGDVMEDGDDSTWDTSSKHGLLSLKKRFGNPGFYRTYTFGVYDGPTGIHDQNPDRSIHPGYRDVDQLKVNYLCLTAPHHDYPARLYHWEPLRGTSK